MNSLKEEVRKFTGKVLCIGTFEDSILYSLRKNHKVEVYTIERTVSKGGLFRRQSKTRLQDGKKVNMKKLRKRFKKKSIDYMLCNINDIYEYFKYFLYDSVYINKKELYVYGESKYIDPNVLAKRFQRYHATVEVSHSGDKFLLIVHNEHSKGNWLKAKFYVIVDTFHNMGDMISAALIS